MSALGADANRERLLKAVENRYNRAQTLEVRFIETYSGAGRAPKSESGSLVLRKPGRMRWDYSSPPGKLFLSDGKNVYLYLPSANRVEKMRLKQSEDMRAPLAFLLGNLNFSKEFQNIQARQEGAGTILAAEAKARDFAYSRVEFVISADFQIRKLRVIGQDQSVLDFVFDQERLNPPLDNKLFQFRTPPGVELVEAAQ